MTSPEGSPHSVLPLPPWERNDQRRRRIARHMRKMAPNSCPGQQIAVVFQDRGLGRVESVEVRANSGDMLGDKVLRVAGHIGFVVGHRASQPPICARKSTLYEPGYQPALAECSTLTIDDSVIPLQPSEQAAVALLLKHGTSVGNEHEFVVLPYRL